MAASRTACFNMQNVNMIINDWVKRCMTREIEGIRQRGRPK